MASSAFQCQITILFWGLNIPCEKNGIFHIVKKILYFPSHLCIFLFGGGEGGNCTISDDNMSSAAAAKVQLEYISQSWYQVL